MCCNRMQRCSLLFAALRASAAAVVSFAAQRSHEGTWARHGSIGGCGLEHEAAAPVVLWVWLGVVPVCDAEACPARLCEARAGR